MKIVIVDDEISALSTFLNNVVDEPDIQPQMFQNDPFAALEYVRTNKVDAAFLDINMPKINGIELAEKMIEIDGGIKIIFITGFSQDEDDIARRIGENHGGYCYKPYDPQTLYRHLKTLQAAKNAQREVKIRTFGAFDVFVDGVPVRFTSAKSKELLALGIDRRGANLTMGDVIALLWPDKNADHAKRLWRDAVVRLRITLKNHGLLQLVEFYRAGLRVNPAAATCDYWDFLDTPQPYTGLYMGASYDWSTETQSYLEKKLLR